MPIFPVLRKLYECILFIKVAELSSLRRLYFLFGLLYNVGDFIALCPVKTAGE